MTKKGKPGREEKTPASKDHHCRGYRPRYEVRSLGHASGPSKEKQGGGSKFTTSNGGGGEENP